MAGSSQHLIQIMATQTRFDLNAAIEGWRNELTAQPQLTPDDRRELEKHLADSVADFQLRGLSDEESFWLAQKRIGRPKQLANEFEKEDPAKVWRERAFWMVLGLLAFSLWQALVDICFLHYHGQEASFHVRRFLLVYVLPVIVLLLIHIWAIKGVTAFCAFFKTRWRFAVSMIAFMGAIYGPQELENYLFRVKIAGPSTRLFWLNEFAFLGYPLVLLVMAIWLLPVQKQSSRKVKPA